jgi:lipoate-protein ligase A
MNIRFIDAGTVSGLRSQSIYHGLGYAQEPDSPNTIVLVTPETPYMCIGFFQDLENELDINYCKKNDLPIIRRETGGGAVYIDKGQLFVQWIFQQNSLPRRVDSRFELFVKPLIETYKFFGIDAYYHPINDVHVKGKKIVGTGAGTIGEAQIVTGNFLFDFNYQTMLKSINLPNQDFRDAVAKNLNNYLTNMTKELDQLPERSEVIKIYRKKCEEILGLRSELGSFNDSELRKMEEMEIKFVEKDWLYQAKRKPSKNKLFKIHLGVWIGYMNYNFDKGSMHALITMKDDYLKEIKLKIDGVEKLNYSIKKLEYSLVGVKMERELIALKVKSSVGNSHSNEWVECIYKMKELQLQQAGHGTMARSN